MGFARYTIPGWVDTWNGFVHVHVQGTYMGVQRNHYIFADDGCTSRINRMALYADSILELQKDKGCEVLLKGKLQRVSFRGAVMLTSGLSSASSLSSRHVTGIEQVADDEEDWDDDDDEDDEEDE